jgi:TolB protein
VAGNRLREPVRRAYVGGAAALRARHCASRPAEPVKVLRQRFDLVDLCRRGARLIISALFLAASADSALALDKDQKPRPKIERLTSDGRYKQHPAWSPDGKLLAFTVFSEGRVGLATIVPGSAEWKPLRIESEFPNFEPAWSPDGARIAFVHDALSGTDGQLQIHLMKPDASDAKVLISPANRPAQDEHPAWSPDGKFLAFTTTRDGNQEIYLWSAADNRLTRLTNDRGSDSHPSFSPDGKKIAFSSSRFGNIEICAMNTDGSQVRRLTDHPALDYAPKWSPADHRIAFTSTRDGNYEIYLIGADGTGLRNVTQDPGLDKDPAWTPDGQRLTFLSNRDGRFDFYVMTP